MSRSMLPLPNTSRRYRPSYPYPPQSPSTTGLINFLRTRTRLTNLAVFILGTILTISLLLNLSHYVSDPALTGTLTKHRSRLKDAVDTSDIPLSIESTIDRDPKLGLLDHLIIVPGHALWIGHDPTTVENDYDWVLEPMQRVGSIRTFVKHIREGVRLLEDDPTSLLVFSGGATRPPPSPSLSESQTYLLLAHALSLIPSSPLPPRSGSAASSSSEPLPLNARTTTEEYALDSYENLLFSLARFKELTGRWPGKVTVVGYEMKRRRFEQLHRAAIRYPLEQFEYIGIDDEGDTTEHYAGELKYGFTPFLSSPSGCHPPLSTKKLLRNPYLRYHPYHSSVPELSDLFEWCPAPSSLASPDDNEGWGLKNGGEVQGYEVYRGSVPWADQGDTWWGREKD